MICCSTIVIVLKYHIIATLIKETGVYIGKYFWCNAAKKKKNVWCLIRRLALVWQMTGIPNSHKPVCSRIVYQFMVYIVIAIRDHRSSFPFNALDTFVAILQQTLITYRCMIGGAPFKSLEQGSWVFPSRRVWMEQWLHVHTAAPFKVYGTDRREFSAWLSPSVP